MITNEVAVALVGVSGLVATGILEIGKIYFTKVIERRKAKFTLSKAVDNEFDIGLHIYTIMDQTQANRVFVCRFHNGGKYINGVPMERFSITNEVFTETLSGVSVNYQARLINDYSGTFQRLFYQGICSYEKVEEIESPVLRSLIEPFGSKSLYLLCIVEKGTPIAFLGIGFNSEVKILSDHTLDQLRIQSQSILPFLSFNNS